MGGTEDAGGYTVVVADNFHYMDSSEHYVHGSFDSLEEAVRAAKTIVDSWLADNRKPGMTAAQLYEGYVAFGEDPFISAANLEGVPFSAWTYAKQRCAELCPDDSTNNKTQDV